MTVDRFAAHVYRERLEAAAQLAAQAEVDALVITPGPDLRYFTSITSDSFERLTALVIPANPASKPYLVIPQMELAIARASALAELDTPILTWVDGDDPYHLVLSRLTRTPQIHPADGQHQLKIAVAQAMPALHLIPLAQAITEPIMLATNIIRQLRMVKDAAEIEALQRAGAAIDRVHARVGQWLRAGRTEAEVAADIHQAILDEGHTAAEFIIVGSGPNGADPHQEITDRVIEDGDIVVVDIGGPVAPGYNSDSTRTYVVGAAKKEVAEKIAVLERAQQAAVAAVRPGATAESIDEAARSVLAEAGLAEHFVHRTGHGIGLSVHEEPYIVAGNRTILEPGMAFSIEPGIYFPGQWGARIEDIVIVTADGCQSVNTRPHGLISVGSSAP